MTFYEWGKQRRITNNPIGDFVADLRHDETAAGVPNTKEAWKFHLGTQRACQGAKDAFEKAWRMYQRSIGNGVYRRTGVGYVYFIQAHESLFKIGMTNQNPEHRLGTIQTGSHYPLSVYGYIETNKPRELEAELHNRFSGCRLSGEWFAVNDTDVHEALEHYSETYNVILD